MQSTEPALHARRLPPSLPTSRAPSAEPSLPCSLFLPLAVPQVNAPQVNALPVPVLSACPA
jgi:hypothetical protein